MAQCSKSRKRRQSGKKAGIVAPIAKSGNLELATDCSKHIAAGIRWDRWAKSVGSFDSTKSRFSQRSKWVGLAKLGHHALCHKATASNDRKRFWVWLEGSDVCVRFSLVKSNSQQIAFVKVLTGIELEPVNVDGIGNVYAFPTELDNVIFPALGQAVTYCGF